MTYEGDIRMDITMNFEHIKSMAPNANGNSHLNGNTELQNLNQHHHHLPSGHHHLAPHTGVAQTASLGNHEMMTYIKAANPTSEYVTGACNSANGTCSTSNTDNTNRLNHTNLQFNQLTNNASSTGVDVGDGGGGNTSDDPGAFLDGLFDRLSGTSDNGSDRGEDSNGAETSTSINLVNGNEEVQTGMSDRQVEDIRPITASAGAGISQVGVQLPQHMLYGVDPNPGALPPNALQFQHPNNGTSNGLNSSGVGGNRVDGNDNTNNDIASSMQPWMMAALKSPIPDTGHVATEQQNQIEISYLNGGQHQQHIQDQACTTSMTTASTPSNVLHIGNVVPVGPPLSISSGPPSTLTRNYNTTAQPQIDEGGTQVCVENVMKKPKRRPCKRSNPSSSSSFSVVSDTTPRTKNKGHNIPLSASSSVIHHDNAESTTTPVSEDESDAQKRRRDRNQREQERSQRIACQIADLKDLLSQSNVAFKPDKYSTLVSVHKHIESLQEKVKNLDEEHKGLLATIAGAGEIVNRGMVGAGSGGVDQVKADQVGSSSVPLGKGTAGLGGNEADIGTGDDDDTGNYVTGLDYKSFFLKCTVALCVASIDGRLLECNNEFIKVCGLTKEVLEASGLSRSGKKLQEPGIKVEENEYDGASTGNGLASPSCEEKTSKEATVLSLFNLLSRDDMGMVFDAMSTMLRSQSTEVTIQSGAGSSLLNHWTGTVDSFSRMQRKLRISITLVRQKCSKPKYFNCVITPCA